MQWEIFEEDGVCSTANVVFRSEYMKVLGKFAGVLYTDNVTVIVADLTLLTYAIWVLRRTRVLSSPSVRRV